MQLNNLGSNTTLRGDGVGMQSHTCLFPTRVYFIGYTQMYG